MKFLQICGYQRSGTSFLSKMLTLHPDIYITGETPRNSFAPSVKHFESLSIEFNKIGGSESVAWTKKRGSYLRHMFVSISKYSEDVEKASSALIFGNKMPRSERFYDLLIRAMGDCEVLFIYCLRDPVEAIESKQNMFRSKKNFEHDLLDYEKSIQTFVDMRSRLSANIKLFTLQAFAENKVRVIGDLLSFMGVNFDPAIVETMANLPARNTICDQMRVRRLREGQAIGFKPLSKSKKSSIEASHLCNVARTLISKHSLAMKGDALEYE